MKKTILLSFGIALTAFTARADLKDIFFDRPFFHGTDPLAARDDWGLTHQSRTTVYETDFAPRYFCREVYYLMSEQELSRHPGYIAALERDLARLGYYCGPIDGVLSDDVRASIATLQKNYSMHVTGTITVPVRRVLHLP